LAKNDHFLKVTILLIVIGVGTLLTSNALPGLGSDIRAFLGSSNMIQVGSNGVAVNLPNGATSQAAVIPSGQVGFKMSIVATYDDGSTETIFEKSTLPGLAVILNGKAVSSISAVTLAAVGLTSALPSGTYAHFELNYTSLISDKTDNCHLQYDNAGAPLTGSVTCSQMPKKFTPRLIGNYRVIDMPLVSNGTLAVAALPALNVLSSDVFPTSVTNSDKRSVEWTVRARVTINAPSGQLSFLGSDLAYADLAFDGTLTGGCTNCGTGTGTLGGVTITPITGEFSFTDDPCYRTGTCGGGHTTEPHTTEPGHTTVAGATVQTIEQTQTVGQTEVFTYATKSVTAPTPVTHTVIVTTVDTTKDKVTQTTKTYTSETKITYKGKVIGDTHYDSEGNIIGGHGVRVTLCLVGDCGAPSVTLPYLSYYQFDLSGGETYRVNPSVIIVVLILVIGYLLYSRRKPS